MPLDPLPPDAVSPVRGAGPPPRNRTGELMLHLLNMEQRLTRTRNGPVIVVSGILEKLSGPAETVLVDALYAPDMPEVGTDYYGVTPFADVPVDEVEVTPIAGSPSKANVRIRYAYPTGSDGFTNFPDETASAQIEVVSAVVPMTTEFCYSGEDNVTKYQILLRYYLPLLDDDGNPIGSSEQYRNQVGEVEVQVPVEIVRYRRREAFNPHLKARKYVGTINSTGVFNDGPHMWLCTRLGGPSDDGGLSYNVTYEFQRNVDSWDKVVVCRDSDTGYPVELTNAEAAALANLYAPPLGEGEPPPAAKCRVYREADWNSLGLTLPLPTRP